MEVLDPGHDYLLHSFDGGEPVRLTFVKRCDPPDKYPGNTNAYPGTQIQEVLRALIDRGMYLEGQISCVETRHLIENCRDAIWWLENRHAKRHDANLHHHINPDTIETVPTCSDCGHIMCFCPAPATGKPEAR